MLHDQLAKKTLFLFRPHRHRHSISGPPPGRCSRRRCGSAHACGSRSTFMSVVTPVVITDLLVLLLLFYFHDHIPILAILVQWLSLLALCYCWIARYFS